MSSRPSRGAARLAAILDALPDALILVNCNGTVVNANSIALEVFESPGTALIGRGLLDLLPEFDSKRIPGSMRRPEEVAEEAERRTSPQRMMARRTDGSAFAVEVTSANLEDARTPYASAVDAAFADDATSGGSYTGDELLMLVVRDLTGTLDTEAELSRQQRQTEMILRAASEGVIGVDGEGRIVLVNPAAAQILGHRAGDLGGQELHPLLHHSRADGTPLPFEETPLADTLRSGRKHRVRAGQVLWTKDGTAVPVDLTSAPVRDGEQLVGAVLTFTDRRPYDQLAARQRQLEAVVGEGLRGPLERMRTELAGLAEDPAGQLWPEANQVLRHLAAGYGRMTTLVDNVLRYQRLDSGAERLRVRTVRVDEVVQSAIEGADELIGPGRAQFAVHTPPIEAELDPDQLATALAHLVADVAGVDSTGNAAPVPAGVDPTIVVAAAQRGDAVRIEVRGPHGGGDAVHQPLVSGIVRQHGGVLQTHEVPGAGGAAFVIELSTAGAREAQPAAPRPVKENETTVMPAPAQPVRGSAAPPLQQQGPGAGAWSGAVAADSPAAQGSSDVGALSFGPEETGGEGLPAGPEAALPVVDAESQQQPTGRRRGRPSPAEEEHEQAGLPVEGARGTEVAATPPEGTGRRARRALAERPARDDGQAAPAAEVMPAAPTPEQGAPAAAQGAENESGTVGGGRRARRIAAARARVAAEAEQGPQHAPFALPSAPEQAAAEPEAGAVPGGWPAAGYPQQAGQPAGGAPAHPAPGQQGSFPVPGQPTGPQPPVPPGQSGASPGAQPTGQVPAQPEQGSSAEQVAPAQPAIPQQATPPEQRFAGEQQPPGAEFASAPAAGAPQQAAQPGPQAPQAPQAPQPPQPQAPQPQQPGALPDPAGGFPGQTPPGGIPPQQGELASGPAAAGEQPQSAPHPQPAPLPAPQAPGLQPPPQAPGPPPEPGQPAPAEQPYGDAGLAPASAAAQPSPMPSGEVPMPPPEQPASGAFDAEHAPEAASAQAAQAEGPAPAEDEEAEPPRSAGPSVVARSPILGGGPLPEQQPAPGRSGPPMPGGHEAYAGGPQVRTLGQGVPFSRSSGEQAAGQTGATPTSAIPSTPSTPTPLPGSGRRRKLATPPDDAEESGAAQPAEPTPTGPRDPRRAVPQQPAPAREFTIGTANGAPHTSADEGPEPLDGPDSPVEVTDGRGLAVPAQALDDELPPEPLDNPRRLLVWPEPDTSTQLALSERGYRPVLVHSREEVDAQIAAYPAALFVDPLTGPITRTALQSLRTAAVAAEVPVLVTAGLGQATREAAYGADPAVLLKALAPRDSEQHPPRVLLVEENQAIAQAFAATLERRGMQAVHADSDAAAVEIAAQVRPNLVVMDLLQVRRRRAGIIDWLRVNGLLNRTPFVVYTSADMDPAELPRLASGETVLFLAERSTNPQVQSRIVDLLTKIGAN